MRMPVSFRIRSESRDRHHAVHACPRNRSPKPQTEPPAMHGTHLNTFHRTANTQGALFSKAALILGSKQGTLVKATCKDGSTLIGWLIHGTADAILSGNQLPHYPHLIQSSEPCLDY